jgi:hypothetical protein
MRILAMVVTASLVVACGGAVVVTGDDAAIDSGTSDSGSDSSPTGTCNGSPCSTYCIHPSTQGCPSCSVLPDGGVCPPGTTLQSDCPAGPAMPPGQYCVSYPTPQAPYCSPTIPPDCWDPSPPSNGTSGDVWCGPALCGA